jgi:hypothetical protein
MATPPFQDWLDEANATLAALHEGQRTATGPDGDAFVNGYCTGLRRSDGQGGDMVKVDDRPGPWMLGYRIGLAGWVVKLSGPSFVERVRDLARKARR